MRRRTTLALAALLAICTCASLGAADGASPPLWPLDHAHSRASFTVTKWGFAEVEGRFHDFTGGLYYDAAHVERSRIEWSVKVASVDTNEPPRDHSLQAAEYFDAARCPTISFKSTRVKSLGGAQLEVAGDLTIRGITKSIIVTATYGGRHDVPGQGPMEIFQTSFTINRYDYGIVGGSVLGPVISKDVRISLTAAARPATTRTPLPWRSVEIHGESL